MPRYPLRSVSPLSSILLLSQSLPSLPLFSSKSRISLAAFFLSVFFGAWLPSTLYAQDLQQCALLFRQKKLVEAGDCFIQAAESIGASDKIKPIDRFKKGRLLLNASRLFTRAAQQTKETPLHDHLIHRSLRLFDRYLDESLFENQNRQRTAQTEHNRLQKRHNFAKLRLSSYDAKAQLCIESTTTPKRCKTAYTWTRYLPAGRYQTSVTYPDSAPILRPLQLSALETYHHGFSPLSSESLVQITSEDPKTRMLLRGAALFEPLRYVGQQWIVKLPPGPYSLDIHYPNALPFRRTFQVSLAEKLTLSYPRPSAQITFTSSPTGAQIFIEERYSGTTPLTVLVPDGDFILHIRSFCHQILQKKILVQPKSSQKIHFDLVPEPRYQTWRQQQVALPTQRLLGWSVLIGGIALGVLAASGYTAGNLAHQDALRLQTAYRVARSNFDQHADAYAAQAQTANAWMTVGHISTPLGAAAIGLGIFFLSQSQLPPPQTLGCDVGQETLKRTKL